MKNVTDLAGARRRRIRKEFVAGMAYIFCGVPAAVFVVGCALALILCLTPIVLALAVAVDSTTAFGRALNGAGHNGRPGTIDHVPASIPELVMSLREVWSLSTRVIGRGPFRGLFGETK